MSVAIQLCISSSAFILLWCSSMGLLTLADALFLFSVLCFVCIGAHYGSWRASFSLSCIFIAITTAIYGYDIIYTTLELNLCNIPILWGQLLCFILTILASLIIWFVLIKNFFPKWVQKKDQNIIWGGIFGGLQGILLMYLLLLVLIVSHVFHLHPWLDQNYKNSQISRLVEAISIGRENLQTMELLTLLRRSCHQYEIAWVSQSLCADKQLQTRLYDFLVWLEQNPNSSPPWYQNVEIQQTLAKLLLISEAKKYWQNDPIIRKLKQQKNVTSEEICEALKTTSSIDLFKNSSVTSLLLQINLDNVKSGNQ